MIIVLIPWNWGSVSVAGTAIPLTQLFGTIIFAAASITDLIDGKIARGRHLVTNFGKFADPLADKMLVMTAFIILVEMGKAPAWVIAIIVCRELAVTGLRLLLAESNEHIVLAAQMPGKIKTTTQMLAIIFLFLNNVFFNNLHFPMGSTLLYICLFFTIYSGAQYFIESRHIFADSFE
jgi:CDP-diacylglycerol--glycerol-3-phosphate 3-phosphatidyltransferase